MSADSLIGLMEMLSNLDVREGVIVGDAIMLRSKIIFDKPKSAMIDF